MVEEKKIPDGYKMSEVGVIPEKWQIKTMRDLLIQKPKYGINAPATEFSCKLPTYIRITDITEFGEFNKKNRVSVNSTLASDYLLSKGDIVFARTGASTGKSYLYNPKDGELVYAGFLINIKPNSEKVDSRYLKYVCNSYRYWKWVGITSMRSGQPGINGEEYGSFLIQLPELKEQQAIATVLSDTDNLILSLEKLINKKNLIKQGTMQELLTGKKRLDGFKEEWVKVKLRDICNVKGGKRLPKGEKLVNKDTGHPYIRVADMNMGGINTKSILFVPETAVNHIKNYKIYKNDLFISVAGTLGIVGCIPDELDGANLTENANKLCDIKCDKLFLMYMLLSDKIQNIISGISTIGAQPKLALTRIENFDICIPYSIEEQEAIARILLDMDKEIEALQKKFDKYKKIKEGMMEELLTGKRRLI